MLEHDTLGHKIEHGIRRPREFLPVCFHARSHSLENPSSKACGKKKSSLPDSQLSFPLYMAVTKVFINMHPSHGTRNENSVE
jgi:hypothetical protein